MEIKFDRSLYALPALKKAILDYKNLADFSCKEKNDVIVVRINNLRAPEQKSLIKEEFSNYVLSLMGTLK